MLQAKGPLSSCSRCDRRGRNRASAPCRAVNVQWNFGDFVAADVLEVVYPVRSDRVPVGRDGLADGTYLPAGFVAHSAHLVRRRHKRAASVSLYALQFVRTGEQLAVPLHHSTFVLDGTALTARWVAPSVAGVRGCHGATFLTCPIAGAAFHT